MSSGCCRQSADFRIGAGNMDGNVCRTDLSDPFESVCRLWQDRHPFPVHTLQASLCVCVCVIALPFLPS